MHILYILIHTQPHFCNEACNAFNNIGKENILFIVELWKLSEKIN